MLFPLIGLAALAVGFSDTSTARTRQVAAPVGLTPYFFGDPSDDETAILEYINRARANPPVEGQRLADAIPYLYDIGSGTVDANKLLTDFNTYPSHPPLVFNAFLMSTTAAHTADMVATGVQSHDGSDGSTPTSRLALAGYPPANCGECVAGDTYATSSSVPMITAWQQHAIYQYDIGNLWPGHRWIIMEPTSIGLVEIGIAHHELGGWNTMDFGAAETVPLLGGVVYTDDATINFYSPGEGVGNVTVTAPGFSSYYATTVASGAYTLPLDLVPPYQPANPSPVVTVVFTDVAGNMHTQAVSLTHTTALGDPTWQYVDATQTPRYDNAKADWIMPGSGGGVTPPPPLTPSPTPSPTPFPTPTPSVTPTPSPRPIATPTPTPSATPTPTPTATPTPVSSVPKVTITPSEDGTVSFTVLRAGDTSQPFTVDYQIKGSAIAGTDYLPLSGRKTMKAGKASVKIRVSVLPGGKGTLKLKLVGTDAYGVSSPSQAKVRLSSSP